jgi:hypothetical protein
LHFKLESAKSQIANRKSENMRRPNTSLIFVLLCLVVACRDAGSPLSVLPRSLREVPAERLAFHFEPDAKAESLPQHLTAADVDEPLASVKADFEGRRGNTEDLKRTVLDPTGQRALAIYGTAETDTEFKIDMYSVEGQSGQHAERGVAPPIAKFIRNVLPHDLTGVFPTEVAWSPDGQSIAFIGVRNPALQASPTPPPDTPPPMTDPAPPSVSEPGVPTPSPGPLIPSVPTFKTEQVYVGNRDGFDLRPLTQRDGLIYFRLAWSPDGRALAALACKEDEWEARRGADRSPAGRPRTITLDGQERLLDDRLTEVAPSWSPDGSKVATAYEFDVAIYDTAGGASTGAAISLRDPLEKSSVAYDEQLFKKTDSTPAPNKGVAPLPSPAVEQKRVLNSFNPFVRVEWIEPETLLAQTAFVRFYRGEPAPVTTYPRWHVIKLSAQAAVVK